MDASSTPSDHVFISADLHHQLANARNTELIATKKRTLRMCSARRPVQSVISMLAAKIRRLCVVTLSRAEATLSEGGH